MRIQGIDFEAPVVADPYVLFETFTDLRYGEDCVIRRPNPGVIGACGEV